MVKTPFDVAHIHSAADLAWTAMANPDGTARIVSQVIPAAQAHRASFVRDQIHRHLTDEARASNREETDAYAADVMGKSYHTAEVKPTTAGGERAYVIQVDKVPVDHFMQTLGIPSDHITEAPLAAGPHL